eukprot:scaffold188563_cov69-Attheya_sp.AAC.1
MNPFPRLSALIYSIGALVKVDPEHRTDRPDSESGKGWDRNFEPDGKATVRYLIDGRESLGIISNRLHQSSLSTRARPRGRGPLPSLLSQEHHRIAQVQNRLPPVRQGRVVPQRIGLAKIFIECRQWVHQIDDNPLLVHLRDGRKKDKGWIWGHEAIIAEREVPKMNSHLILPERELVVQCMAIITSIVPETMRLEGSHPVADLAYGFGVTRQCIQELDRRVLSRNNDASRKRRCDAGETVFTSNKKQAAVFTPLHFYKKWRRLNAPGEVFDDLELGRELELLNERDTQHFEEGAASFQEQAPYLFSEIGRFLCQTKGRITWRKIATAVGGGEKSVKPVSHVTIMAYVMDLPDSTYTSTRIFPMLTAQSKMIRKRWAIAWHLFWEGAKCVAGGVQFVLFQDDEKWFYSLVVRQHNKL